MTRADKTIAFLLCCGAFVLGEDIGYRLGKTSVQRGVVYCDPLEKSPEPGYYVCRPVNENWKVTK